MKSRRANDYFLKKVEMRVMSEDLKKQGWTKRTTIGEPRLSEIVEEYEALGFEVHLEPVNLAEMDEECRRCYRKDVDKIKTVYTRKRQS